MAESGALADSMKSGALRGGRIDEPDLDVFRSYVNASSVLHAGSDMLRGVATVVCVRALKSCVCLRVPLQCLRHTSSGCSMSCYDCVPCEQAYLRTGGSNRQLLAGSSSENLPPEAVGLPPGSRAQPDDVRQVVLGASSCCSLLLCASCGGQQRPELTFHCMCGSSVGRQSILRQRLES
jgi:hypothetical protein